MDKAILLDWYRQMVLVRRFEQKCAELYQLGKIGGFLHLYIGQEATAVGSIGARRPQDHVITAYRDHAHALIVGADPAHADLQGGQEPCGRLHAPARRLRLRPLRPGRSRTRPARRYLPGAR